MTIHWIITMGSVAFGAVIGSFLNVCVYRIPKGESLVYPGSHCPDCGARIRWFDNVPVISFLLLRGRCRDCGGRISFRYPLLEALSAALCFALVARYGLTWSAGIYFAFSCALVVVTFIDLDHQIIPNRITYPGIPLGVAASFVLPEMSLRQPLLEVLSIIFRVQAFLHALPANLVNSVLGILLGGGVLLGVALLFEWVRKKEGMGFGDVKLLAMVGAFLGVDAVLVSILISSAVGSVVGYLALRLSGKGTEQPIPYGPFLALGAIIYLLWGKELVNWYLGTGGQ